MKKKEKYRKELEKEVLHTGSTQYYKQGVHKVHMCTKHSSVHMPVLILLKRLVLVPIVSLFLSVYHLGHTLQVLLFPKLNY